MLNIFDSKNNDSKSIKPKRNDPSPSMSQGKKFKKIKNSKISNNLEIISGIEGFTGLSEDGLTSQTNKIINDNDYSNQKQTINELRQAYDITLKQYNDLAEKISGNLSTYINRVNLNNPYLNKTVEFTTGEVCYVTNQGVVKLIPSQDIWKSLDIPHNVQVKLNIPWNDTYSTPGTQIPTDPPLVSGTTVKSGQSFGNEGSNIYVNQLLPQETKASYMGCYATSPNNNNMTFIGDKPPTIDVSIQNGTFSQPILQQNSFKYITGSNVPGWYFGGAVLLNNSTAWNYPMPYPNGNQCVSIQNETYLNTLLNLNAGVTYTLSFYACGRNCCMNPNSGNPINIQLYTNLDAFISELYNFTSPVNSWTKYTTTFTVPKTDSYKLQFKGTNNSGDRSTAVQNISLSGATETQGRYTYNDCMQSAIQNGYQYFALQNVNEKSLTGYCAVSNSSPEISKYGDATIISKMIPLWSSNTQGTGNVAFLSNNGSLQVLNSSGKSIYSSPVDDKAPSNYLGCYQDCKNGRALPTFLGNGKTYDTCQAEAQKGNWQYFGLQYNQPNGTSECWVGNDIGKGMSMGEANNCKILDNTTVGGGCSNAIYSSKAGSNYFLILQDDSNMVVYRGTSPSDNQGGIWSTKTNGKKQSANKNMVASKGKYGQNWMPSGGTLAPGNFIGSNDGKLALVMQMDGNLVLYTYQTDTNCQKMSDGNIGGGELANAAYDIGKTAIKSNMGKLAYIDANSELHSYPSNNETYLNTYSVIKNANTPQGNIAGAAYNGATLESCQKTCDENSNCAGFVFSGSSCWPKNTGMYPYNGTVSTANGVNIYVRNKAPSSPPTGVTQNTTNVDTLKYSSYLDGGNIGSKYGLADSNNIEKQQLDQLQTKLDLLSTQIAKLTGKFGFGATISNSQGEKNNSGIGNYFQDIKETNTQIKDVAVMTSGGLQNILKDSDIVVLQKNYDYLFWSILAAGTVLVSMNIVKKQ